MSHVIAIDMGGTKTATAVFDQDGRLIDRAVEPTVRLAPADAVAAIAEQARSLRGSAEAAAVAMALPAIVGPDGSVVWAASSVAGWDGAPLARLLSAAFDLPAGAMFDGYAATLGEATFGAGRGHDSVATLVVGTGFGAGLWLNGRVIEGRTGVAGAVGWNRWPSADGRPSAPAEAIASGTGIVATARRSGNEDDYPDAQAVFDRAAGGIPLPSPPSTRPSPWPGSSPVTSSICWHLNYWCGREEWARDPTSRTGPQQSRSRVVNRMRLRVRSSHDRGSDPSRAWSARQQERCR